MLRAIKLSAFMILFFALAIGGCQSTPSLGPVMLQTAASRVITVDAVKTELSAIATTTPHRGEPKIDWLIEIPNGSLYLTENLRWAGLSVSSVQQINSDDLGEASGLEVIDAVRFRLLPDCGECEATILLFVDETGQSEFRDYVHRQSLEESYFWIFEFDQVTLAFSQETDFSLAEGYATVLGTLFESPQPKPQY